MKHYFLGTAANVSKKERILRRKLKGSKADYDNLTTFLTKYYGGEKALALRNGRSAIAAGLKYSGLKKGEVIVNGFTCRAVVQGIEGAGMTPVYADISKKNLNFSISDLEKVLTKNTRAIIVQNTLGNMVKINEVEAFCKKHHLLLVEDLAHCFGLSYDDGREAGTVGDITVLSFGKEKMIDAGNGGVVIFRHETNVLEEPKNRPPENEEFRSRVYPTIGYIFRKLSYAGLASLFMRLMLKMGYVVKSAEGEVDLDSHLGYFQSKLALMKLKSHNKNTGLLREFYLVNNREECLNELKRSGYYFGGFWYERPVAPERYYKKISFPEKECKNAVFVSKHIINFPTYYNNNELECAHKIMEKYLIKDENE